MLSPIDGHYFTTLYFWITTIIACVLGLWFAVTME